jgi:hypothetical protein
VAAMRSREDRARKLKSLLSIVGVAAVVAMLVLVHRVTTSPDVPSSSASQPTAVADVRARGAPTAGPTGTPIALQEDAERITAEAASGAALKSADSVDGGSVTSSLATAGDYPSRFPAHHSDYPIWVVEATGTFRPSFGLPRAVSRSYSSATIYVDAATVLAEHKPRIMGVHLSDIQSPTE